MVTKQHDALLQDARITMKHMLGTNKGGDIRDDKTHTGH